MNGHDALVIATSVAITLFVLVRWQWTLLGPPLIAVYEIELHPRNALSRLLTPAEDAYLAAQNVTLPKVVVHAHPHHTRFEVSCKRNGAPVVSRHEALVTDPGHVTILWTIPLGDDPSHSGLEQGLGHNRPRLEVHFQPFLSRVVVGVLGGRFDKYQPGKERGKWGSGLPPTMDGAPHRENLLAAVPLSIGLLRKCREKSYKGPEHRWNFLATHDDPGFTWFVRCSNVAGRVGRFW
jgi:hypothetical protein